MAASRPMARQCLPCQPSSSRLFVPPCRRLPLQPQTRLNLGSALGRWWFLVNVCTSGGKTLISRINLCPSATCRALRACLLDVRASLPTLLRSAESQSRPSERREELPLQRQCSLDPHLPREASYVVKYLYSKRTTGLLGDSIRNPFEVPLSYL